MNQRLSSTALIATTVLMTIDPVQAQDAKALRAPASVQVEEVTVGPDHQQQQFDMAQRQAEHQLAQLRYAADDYRSAVANARLHTVVPRVGSTPLSGQTLLIRTGDLDPDSQKQLEEDLNVMSRILSKATEDEAARGPRAMGIDLMFGPGFRPVRSLYLEGYGALFMVDVNFPLIAPPTPEEDETAEPKGETETTWEQAREELYGVPHPPEPAVALGWNQEIAEGQEYDAEKVERLRQTLLESIKNATNIRQLTGKDFVTLCVLGGPTSTTQLRRQESIKKYPRQTGTSSNVSLTGQGYAVVLEKEIGSAAPRAVMTFQARKSDIDRFARGEITLDQFRELTQTQIYPGGHGSWNVPNSFIWSKN
jgi:hypothetical protein